MGKGRLLLFCSLRLHHQKGIPGIQPTCPLSRGATSSLMLSICFLSYTRLIVGSEALLRVFCDMKVTFKTREHELGGVPFMEVVLTAIISSVGLINMRIWHPCCSFLDPCSPFTYGNALIFAWRRKRAVQRCIRLSNTCLQKRFFCKRTIWKLLQVKTSSLCKKCFHIEILHNSWEQCAKSDQSWQKFAGLSTLPGTAVNKLQTLSGTLKSQITALAKWKPGVFLFFKPNHTQKADWILPVQGKICIVVFPFFFLQGWNYTQNKITLKVL